MTDARGNRFRHVIVVADRKALEEQLGAVVHGFLEAHDDLDLLDRAESCAHLRQLVANDDDSERPCRVIVTTFQKALTRGVDAQPATPAAASANAADAANAADDGDGSDDGESPSVVEATHAVASTDGPCSQRRVAILADEAHRSHGHGTTASLHALLCGGVGQERHISYVAFSATPSDVALRLFGVLNHEKGTREPFHTFALRDALASGLCVDVLARYTTSRPSVSVYDKHGTRRDLEHVLSAPTRKGASLRAVARAAAARRALLEAKAIGALTFTCEALAEARHAGMDDPKVMMVVRSRQHCADYRAALLALLASRARARAERAEPARASSEAASAAAVRSSPVPLADEVAAEICDELAVLVAFSGTLDEGGCAVSERTLNGGDVLPLFQRRGAALLIVCAKFETGFDEPRICAMVIDRPLRGAHAVQVLGRANRVCANKPPPRVLDFANAACGIAAAFRSFLGARKHAMAEHERRVHLGRELAHISASLLMTIAERSVRAVVEEAVVHDTADVLAASVDEYVRGCEALGEEAAALPFGYATRLLTELRTASAASASQHQPQRTAPIATTRAHAVATGAIRGGMEDDGTGGYSVRIGALATTFSGRIAVDGEHLPATRLHTRPLSLASDLPLMGDDGAAVTLPAAAAAAAALAERSVAALLAGASSSSSSSSVAAAQLGMDELRKADAMFRELLRGRVSAGDGQAALLRLLRRPPPSVAALRSTKVGTSLRSLAKGHGHSTIVALAGALLERWKAAAEAEERRTARAAALKLPTAAPPAEPSTASGLTGRATSAAASSQPDGAARGCSAGGDAPLADPMRQVAAVHLAEALATNGAGGSATGSNNKNNNHNNNSGSNGAGSGAQPKHPSHTDATARDGALAASIEAALFAASGASSGKAYRSRARSLCSSLRSARGNGLRKRLRDGELSAERLCAMGDKELAEAMLSEEDKRKKAARKEREDRAIDAMRIENAGEVTDAYTCESCKGKRCAQFHTNSMGAVHLSVVPDMIINCLDCGHTFTL